MPISKGVVKKAISYFFSKSRNSPRKDREAILEPYILSKPLENLTWLTNRAGGFKSGCIMRIFLGRTR